MKDVKSHLNKAAKLLETKGWTTGVYSNAEGECCLLGALGKTCRSDRQFELSRDFVAFYIGTTSPSLWNDSQSSSEPVIAALRGAASIL